MTVTSWWQVVLHILLVNPTYLDPTAVATLHSPQAVSKFTLHHSQQCDGCLAGRRRGAEGEFSRNSLETAPKRKQTRTGVVSRLMSLVHNTQESFVPETIADCFKAGAREPAQDRLWMCIVSIVLCSINRDTDDGFYNHTYRSRTS